MRNRHDLSHKVLRIWKFQEIFLPVKKQRIAFQVIPLIHPLFPLFFYSCSFCSVLKELQTKMFKSCLSVTFTVIIENFHKFILKMYILSALISSLKFFHCLYVLTQLGCRLT